MGDKMPLLSLIEASKAFSVAESTLRYWVAKDKVKAQTEIRNGRPVVVLDEDELRTYIQQDQANNSRDNFTGEDEQERPSLPVMLEWAKEQLSKKDATIDDLRQQVNDLQFKLGEATGCSAELRVRLQEKDQAIERAAQEIQEWKRQAAVTQELHSRPWWKRIFRQ